MQAGTLIPFQLPSQAYSASGAFQIALDTIPKRINNGLISHVAKFNFILPLTTTFSSGVGSIVGDNSAVNQSIIYDGIAQRFQGGFNELRTAERMQLGKPAYADETLAASAAERVICREFNFGPKNLIGAPSDFLLPALMLMGSTIQGQFGSLAAIDTNCTVATGTMRTIAWLYGLDSEMRIPPVYEVRTISATGGYLTLPGTYAYDFIAMYKSTYADWAAGEVGNVTVDFGTGPLTQAVNATDIGREFAVCKNAGTNGFSGQPSSANDVSIRSVNEGTPTALAAAENNIQPAWFSPINGKISKLTTSTGTAYLQWNGTVTSAQVQVGRFIPQNAQTLSVYAQRAMANMPDLSIVSQKIKTLKGADYKGNMGPYMPITLKLTRK